MAPSPLDKQISSCNSPHNWLMSLAMNLATLCGVELKIASIDALWLFSVLTEDLPATSWLPTTPPSTPIKLLVALTIASEKTI